MKSLLDCVGLSKLSPEAEVSFIKSSIVAFGLTIIERSMEGASLKQLELVASVEPIAYRYDGRFRSAHATILLWTRG